MCALCADYDAFDIMANVEAVGENSLTARALSLRRNRFWFGHMNSSLNCGVTVDLN